MAQGMMVNSLLCTSFELDWAAVGRLVPGLGHLHHCFDGGIGELGLPLARQSTAARCVMGICLQGAQRQQCAEDQIGDHGFQQGAGQPLVASRPGDVAGDHDGGGQRHPEPEPEHPCSLLRAKQPQRAASI